MRCFGHEKRRCTDTSISRCESLAIVGTGIGKGRPEKYPEEVIRQDMTHFQLTEDMTLDRRIQRSKIMIEGQWQSSIVQFPYQYYFYYFSAILFFCFIVSLASVIILFVIATVPLSIVFIINFFTTLFVLHTRFLICFTLSGGSSRIDLSTSQGRGKTADTPPSPGPPCGMILGSVIVVHLHLTVHFLCANLKSLIGDSSVSPHPTPPHPTIYSWVFGITFVLFFSKVSFCES